MQKHTPVRELRVPTRTDNRFEAYFHGLIRASLLRSAEADYAHHRNAGHGLRARRAGQALARAQAIPDDTRAAVPRFGPGALALTRIAWVACALLVAGLAVSYGVGSWATGAADLALIALTFALFAVAWGSDIRFPRS
jgi:hypothetical protein